MILGLQGLAIPASPKIFDLFGSYHHFTSIADIDAGSRGLAIELSAIEGVPYFLHLAGGSVDASHSRGLVVAHQDSCVVFALIAQASLVCRDATGIYFCLLADVVGLGSCLYF